MASECCLCAPCADPHGIPSVQYGTVAGPKHRRYCLPGDLYVVEEPPIQCSSARNQNMQYSCPENQSMGMQSLGVSMSIAFFLCTTHFEAFLTCRKARKETEYCLWKLKTLLTARLWFQCSFCLNAFRSSLVGVRNALARGLRHGRAHQ